MYKDYRYIQLNSQSLTQPYSTPPPNPKPCFSALVLVEASNETLVALLWKPRNNPMETRYPLIQAVSSGMVGVVKHQATATLRWSRLPSSQADPARLRVF